ncbi:hypothetical protein GF323_01975 [Candidatus Woesearchaeota archaeon]|nr:hypothetical protein [Candidatus Woesearchaeota archaeon]
MYLKIAVMLLIIAFLSSMSLADDFISLNLECDPCIQQRNTTWNLEITNFGDKELNLLGFRIKDSEKGKEIYYYEKESPVEIYKMVKQKFVFYNKIPYPNSDNKLIVHPCLITRPELESWGKAGRRIEYCYDDINFTFDITQCLADFDCLDEQACSNMSCITLNCSYCQYPKYHRCYDYECCQDTNCSKNQICVEHECTLLECEDKEYIINHTCTSGACGPEEGIINFTCKKLDCKYGEYIRNHTCVELGCSFDEAYFNHSCLKLNCSFDEAYFNHSCLKLNCSFDEYISGHECKKLHCNIFQKAEGHECRINSNIILFIFLLFMIYFLIILNINKYRYLNQKKLVNFFLRKKASKGENIKTDKEDSGEEKENGTKHGNDSKGKQSNNKDAGKKA